MLRKQGYSLGLRFTKQLWTLWDSLTPEEREAYEQYYEDKDNTHIKKVINDRLNLLDKTLH